MIMKNINEINKEMYRPFYSMNELVQAMSRNQKVWCWAARGWTNMNNKFLKFRVSGHLFKGYVYLGVNGKDLFDVFLVSSTGIIKDEINDIYIEDLISRIDEKVEKLPAYKW